MKADKAMRIQSSVSSVVSVVKTLRQIDMSQKARSAQWEFKDAFF